MSALTLRETFRRIMDPVWIFKQKGYITPTTTQHRHFNSFRSSTRHIYLFSITWSNADIPPRNLRQPIRDIHPRRRPTRHCSLEYPSQNSFYPMSLLPPHRSLSNSSYSINQEELADSDDLWLAEYGRKCVGMEYCHETESTKDA